MDTSDRIVHLLRRSGFAAAPEDIERGIAQGLEHTVEALVEFEQASEIDLIVHGLDVDSPRPPPRFLETLQIWWLKTMVSTTRPLQEKMVLFWHDLFATSKDGVKDVRQMYLQNQNFRGNFNPDTGRIINAEPDNPFPVGNFQQMLVYLTKDPAMLYWLDNRLNRRLNDEVGGNENYARELHELFSMGAEDAVARVPNYTERDVRQAARALTGWTVNTRLDERNNFPRTFRFDAERHDPGPYEHLGHVGGDNADFIFQNIVTHRHPGQRQSAVGRFLGFRLFSFFGYENPEPEIVNALAGVFDGANGEAPYEIRSMLRTLFMPGNPVSEAFYSEQAFRAHVKSPAEYLVGTVTLLKPSKLDWEEPHTKAFVTHSLQNMGQTLFRPPNVNGWREGLGWMNASLAMARFNFANALTSGPRKDDPLFDVSAFLERNDLQEASSEEMVDAVTLLLLQAPVSDHARQMLVDYMNAPIRVLDHAERLNIKVRGLIHLIMCMPRYQLS
ncbi:MAG: hypothetical protein ETSY2_02530 [Candidatus Entotheonella gemina]|uniref:DUF1800 domain-containing protein n=1 Tax=Candidatus Entotheonella gemina TaxID=1429439 RepID=W4MFE3_9BACT|nr:MAG: hypothetical protein ETSY2_02530 [Candidatus Entotheonella gemina]